MKLTIERLPKDTQNMIETLRDKVENKTATDEEASQFRAWCRYLEELNANIMREMMRG